jgi:hypothetical protein
VVLDTGQSWPAPRLRSDRYGHLRGSLAIAVHNQYVSACPGAGERELHGQHGLAHATLRVADCDDHLAPILRSIADDADGKIQ